MCGAICLPALVTSLLAGCGGARTAAPVTIRSLTGPPLLIEPPPLVERQVIARARTAALATDVDNVYFGDLARDELYAAPKRGGERIRIGDRAPLEIALGERITWIGAPGNILLAARPNGGSSVLIQTSGLFTDVASDSRDVLVTNAMEASGVILRMTGSTASSVATLDVRPLELATDSMTAYVLSDRAIHAVRRTGGAPRVVLEGVSLAGLEVAGGFIFATGMVGPSRALLRISTSGGEPVVLERAVRRAPFSVFAEDVYFLDADQPELRRVAVLGGPSGFVARAPELARVTELVVDASGIYLATEDEIGPVVLGLPRPP